MAAGSRRAGAGVDAQQACGIRMASALPELWKARDEDCGQGRVPWRMTPA